MSAPLIARGPASFKLRAVPGLRGVKGDPGRNGVDGILQANGAAIVRPKYKAVYAQAQRPLEAFFGDMINLYDIDPVAQGGVDICAPLNAVRQDSPARPVLVQPGQFQMSAPLPVLTGAPLSIYGRGGNGDGPADYDYQNAIIFILEFAAGNAFSAVTNFPCHFENFRIETDVQFRDGYQGTVVNSGSAISVSGSTGNNARTIVRNVGVAEKDIGVRINKGALGEITMCSFLGWKTAGIYNETDVTREGGGGFIRHNGWNGHSGTPAQVAARGPCIFSTTGYIWIESNNMSGGRYGVYLNIRDRPAGAPRIVRNTIEDYYTAGVFATTQDGSLCSMLAIDDNEFSVVDARPDLIGTIYLNEYAAPWLEEFSICRNIIRNNQTAPSAPFIAVRGGSAGKVNGNQLVSLSGSPQAGVAIIGANTNAALGGPIEAYDNQFLSPGGGGFSFFYSVAPGIVDLRHKQAMSASDLAGKVLGSPTNGSEVSVSDGASGSNPVSGGGGGTKAKRIAGAWVGGDEAPGAWTAYTPNVSAGSGSISALGANLGAYQVRGKTVDFRVDVTITTNGSAATYIVISLPPGLGAKGLVTFIGTEKVVTGEAVRAYTNGAGDGAMVVLRLSNSGYPGGNGARIVLNGSYETA